MLSWSVPPHMQISRAQDTALIIAEPNPFAYDCRAQLAERLLGLLLLIEKHLPSPMSGGLTTLFIVPPALRKCGPALSPLAEAGQDITKLGRLRLSRTSLWTASRRAGGRITDMWALPMRAGAAGDILGIPSGSAAVLLSWAGHALDGEVPAPDSVQYAAAAWLHPGEAQLPHGPLTDAFNFQTSAGLGEVAFDQRHDASS